jgi:hypothetical protein
VTAMPVSAARAASVRNGQACMPAPTAASRAGDRAARRGGVHGGAEAPSRPAVPATERPVARVARSRCFRLHCMDRRIHPSTAPHGDAWP